MATDWEEVKRLAADFQRAQLSSTVQRLSERNCIEIVKKLIDLKLIEVIFTVDGKEYITPEHLLKEIRDELYVQNGRINLVDLAHNLNVDLSHIESKVGEFVTQEPDVTIVLGQLIDRSYLDRVAEEVNEKLQQNGQITIGELTKQYDLPGEFLHKVVSERLGTLIQGQADQFDPRTIFTDSYVAQHKAVIRGVMSALTRPVQVSALMSRFGFPERLFFSICEELLKDGRLPGSLSGGRVSDRTTYIPNIYATSQNEWVDNFFKQNGYLEYDSLSRLGIQDVKAYIQRRFKNEKLIFLGSCCIGSSIFEQVESMVQEAMVTGSWVDVQPILPSVLSTEDAHQVVTYILKSKPKTVAKEMVFCETMVVSDALLQSCLKHFESVMETKAKEDIQKGIHIFVPSQPVSVSHAKNERSSEEPARQTGGVAKTEKKDDRRKKAAAGGKTGGGTQGRESKSKAVKKKYNARGGRGGDESDDSGDDNERAAAHNTQSIAKGGKPTDLLEFLTVTQVQETLRQLNEVWGESPPDELLKAIAEHIHRPLTRKYREIAETIFLSSSSLASGSARRKLHTELQERLTTTYADLHMYIKGIQLFKEDLQAQLMKHLLRTLCSELVNGLVAHLAVEQGVMANAAELTTTCTPEVRQKVINKFPENKKNPLNKLHTSLNAKTLEDFLAQLETACELGDFMLKKMDKKRERQALSINKQALLEQLNTATDPALTLHLAVVLLFQTQTRTMLHISGKFVPQVIAYLRPQLTDEVFKPFEECQDLVIKLFSQNETNEEVKLKLDEILPKIKDTAVNFRKATNVGDD